MGRSIPWFWIGLVALVLLAPGPLGRLLLNFLGGLTLLVLLLPVLLAGVGWIAWRILRSRIRVCAACGTATLASGQCPACGASLVSPSASGDGSVTWEPFASSPQPSGVAQMLFRFGVASNRDDQASEFATTSDPSSEIDAGNATIDIPSRPVNDD
ncbi:MAG: hypothetical protein N3Z29_03305 [Synechococcaceae cyanobacterium MAG-AL1]|nr:hypothetical protein [Candidatus Regnicoccus frigidus MAG-AL1]